VDDFADDGELALSRKTLSKKHTLIYRYIPDSMVFLVREDPYLLGPSERKRRALQHVGAENRAL
jgi:hypothetical protein